MSTNPPPVAPTPPSPQAAAIAPKDVEIKIISHSNLFYWWPVWAVGFLMSLLTLVDGHRLAIVPKDTIAESSRGVDGHEGKHDVLISKEKSLPAKDKDGKPTDPKLHMAANKSYGVIFAMTLLIVIFITNVPLRGLWSVVFVIMIVMLAIIFHLAGWWESIFEYLSLLHIQINLAGYLFISLVLFAIWILTMLFFDRQMYMVFTPGQLKVCTEIGGGEKAYDTSGMTIEKQRSDLFRHWILGLGSGDLIVNTSGAAVHHFDLPNVLFVGRKVQMIEDMLREKAVVRGR